MRTVASADPTTPPGAPSWGRVLATTLGLWASRRLLRPLGLRRPRPVLLLVICVLVVGAAAVGAVRLTGTSSRGARVSSSARPHQLRPAGSAGAARSAGTREPSGVRASSPGGAATYQAALAADFAARRSAGAQLLHSRRIEVGAQGAAQLQAGQVDSRLLVMLAMLASQRSWRVIAFGGASPGVPLTEAPFRQVIITSAGGTAGRNGADGLAAALALVRAQRAPYQPAQVTTVLLADGQTGLRIDFAAPSPLGLLSGGAPR